MNLTVRKRDGKGRYLPAVEPEKKRKAIVRYRRTADGQNRIVSLEGFLTFGEIKALGPEVYRLWEEEKNQMYQLPLNGAVWVFGFEKIFPSDIYADEKFNQLISVMKACGKALSRIIRNVRAAELNEVRVLEI